MNRGSNLAKVQDDQDTQGRYEYVPARVSAKNGKQGNPERVSPNKAPHLSVVDNRVDNRRVQNITINHHHAPQSYPQSHGPQTFGHPSPSHHQLAGGQRKVSLLLGFGIFFLPFIFAWFTLQQGYSTVARAVSFIWLALYVLSTCADMKESDNRVRNIKAVQEQKSTKTPSDFRVA